jgi:hypothetical protein
MPIYGLTIFFGAFLLFQIEPMIAKYIQPWFGGAPTVWTTCLLFFQTLLLAGYTYAHVIGTRLSPRRQATMHLALVVTCVAAMLASALLWNSPVLPGVSWKAARAEYPVARILLLLSLSIGLPYFALSATAPLLQSWFARIYPGRSPYRLYSLSNFGSLVALLTYPFAVEPRLTLQSQSNFWTCLYLVFAIGMAFCALQMRGVEPYASEEDASTERPTLSTLTLWFALPACASFLLYAGTGQLTQDTAPVPFLWILPLALYLLSFIVCFDSERWYRRGIFHPLLGAAIFLSPLVVLHLDRSAAAIAHLGISATAATLLIEIGNVLILVFAGCMVCHGELARLKPHRKDLTVFYLVVSAGGALGGIVSVVVMPLLFSGFWDFRFAVWSCVVLLAISVVRDGGSWVYRRTLTIAVSILSAALVFPLSLGVVEHWGIYLLVALAAIAILWRARQSKNPPRLLLRRGIEAQSSMMVAIAILAFTYINLITLSMHDAVWFTRNFYGLFRVIGTDAPDRSWHSYRLLNGRVSHGEQFFSDAYPRMRYYPTTYYGLGSGVGLVMMNHPRRADAENSSLRVGVVGLGVGTIAAWGRPGDYFRFYEINPAVVSLATDPNGYFSFIRDSSARVEIVAGDGRLSMESELAEGHPQNFDVLVIDAFTGDAVPTHLLTREAMLTYLRELAPDGVLAVHISNLYLDLAPVLAEHGRTLNLKYRFVHAEEKDLVDWASDWVLLSRDNKIFEQPEIAARLKSDAGMRRVRPWTDDYSNLFQLLN